MTTSSARPKRFRFRTTHLDAALAQLVVHHLDRPRAFAEIRRVLRSSGRLAITTTDPAAFPTFWMQAFFPSYAAIERARFPDGETLRRELGGAGFRRVEIVPQAIRRRFSREDALAKLTGRAYSTFVHMSATEYEAGVVAAAELLPDVVDYELRLLHVLAA